MGNNTTEVLPFCFIQPTEKVIQEMNRELPLKLIAIEPLIDRVARRYPYASKSEVTRIIKAFFDVMREQLVNGRIVFLMHLATEMKLRFYPYHKFGRRFASLKVRLTSPNSFIKPTLPKEEVDD